MINSQSPQIDNFRSGTTTVEFALVLPLVLLLVFGLVEFSRVNIIRNTMQNAAYEGARVAIIPGGTAAEAEAEAVRIINGVGVIGETVTVSPSTINLNTPQVTVTVEVPLMSNLWVTPRFFGNSTVTRTCILTRESSQSGF